MQILQNKFIRLWLSLISRINMNLIESEKINWLPIKDRFKQCIGSMTFKYFNYWVFCMSNVFKSAGQNTTSTRTSLFKFSQPLWKTNDRQKSVSYVAPSIWNKLQRMPTRTNTKIKRFFFADEYWKNQSS